MAGENAVPEAGCEALDLIFESLGHVNSRSIRNVTVGPYGVLSDGGAGCVEETGLCEQHEGPLGNSPLGYFLF